MKRFGMIRLTMLAALALAVAPAGAAPTAAETEAARKKALEKLVRDNNDAVRRIRQRVESTTRTGWGVRLKVKDLAEISSNVTEIVRLLSLKEGAADCMTKGDALALKAHAFSTPVNLRQYAQVVKAFDEALAAQEDADRRALVAFERGQYLFDCGQEPVEACEKLLTDVYATPGIGVRTKLRMLEKGVPGLEYRAEGRKLVDASGDQALMSEWYLKEASGGLRKADSDPLDPRDCAAYKLRTCDEAIAKLDAKYHDAFIACKVKQLKAMSRWEDAEKVLMAKLFSITNVADGRRVHVYCDLASLYADRAERYSMKPDAALSQKAIGFWESALRLSPGYDSPLYAIARQAIRLEDLDLIEKTLDRLTAVRRDHKPDAWMTAVYGDVAYMRGDYEKAVAWYRTYPNFPDVQWLVRIPNSHQRFAGALYATGRYEECLKALDGCPNFMSFKDANKLYRRILKEKIAAKGVK